MKDPLYNLSVKFISGNELPLSEGITHEVALHHARLFIDAHSEDHRVHRTGRSFETVIRDPDNIVVMELSTNKYHPAGMHMVLKIREQAPQKYNFEGQDPRIAEEESHPEVWSPKKKSEGS